jgi:DNA-binding transcriptional LysR family regulator
MQSRVDWDDLRLVLAVLRAGSLKGAATLLRVNVSTVSRRLDALEGELQQVLFDRTPEGTRPTEAATLLVPYAEQMEEAANRAALELEGLEAEPEGLVRITAPPGVAEHFVTPRLPALFRRHPKLRVELSSEVGYADLSRREADLALRASRPTSGDLVAIRLGVADYAVIAAPKMIRRLGNVRELRRSPWITYGSDLDHLPEVAWVLESIPHEQIVLRTNSITAQLEAVRAGIGIKLEVRPFLSLSGLAELPMPKRCESIEVPRGELWLVGHRALRSVPRVAATWEFLADIFKRVLLDE